MTSTSVRLCQMQPALLIVVCLVCGCAHDRADSPARMSQQDAQIGRVERDLQALLVQIVKYEEYIQVQRPKDNHTNGASYFWPSEIKREEINPSNRYLKDLKATSRKLETRLESLKRQADELSKSRLIHIPGRK